LKGNTVIIRSFSENDFLAVQNIYQQGIDTGNATFQTEAKSWQQWKKPTRANEGQILTSDIKTFDWLLLAHKS